MTELRVRTGRPQPAARPTLVDHIDRVIDRLYQLRRCAANERRSHGTTEQLLDGLDATGTYLKRAARGA